MKKLLYVLGISMLVFAACNSLDNNNSENVDANVLPPDSTVTDPVTEGALDSTATNIDSTNTDTVTY